MLVSEASARGVSTRTTDAPTPASVGRRRYRPHISYYKLLPLDPSTSPEAL